MRGHGALSIVNRNFYGGVGAWACNFWFLFCISWSRAVPTGEKAETAHDEKKMMKTHIFLVFCKERLLLLYVIYIFGGLSTDLTWNLLTKCENMLLKVKKSRFSSMRKRFLLTIFAYKINFMLLKWLKFKISNTKWLKAHLRDLFFTKFYARLPRPPTGASQWYWSTCYPLPTSNYLPPIT